MDLELKDKVVVITGGSKGIGLAVARGFAAEGARVAIIARGLEGLEAAREELAELGCEAATVAADLTDPTQASNAIAQIEARLGHVDILVNSAGAARRHNAEELDPEKWQAAMNAKFFPYVYTQDAVLKSMRKHACHGAIINIIGMGGKVATTTHLAGGAANAALMLATVGLAQHYAQHGIRINAINPGPTYTQRADQRLEVEARRLGISKEQAMTDGQAHIPLGRYARPEEVADVAVFLASARASYVIGAIVPMSGGLAAVI